MFILGTLVLLALELITPFFRFIPKATLSSILICAVIFLVDYQIVKPLWKFYSKLPILILVTAGSEVQVLNSIIFNLDFV
jgi:Sulfate permease and related transporters (MFS superfamily)